MNRMDDGRRGPRATPLRGDLSATLATGLKQPSGENRGTLSRRAALLAPLALAGCETIDSWFNPKKDPLPGKRESLGILRRGFNTDDTAPKVSIPAAVHNDSWPQEGGNPAHLMGNLSLARGADLKQAWVAELGEGGGYRRKILAQPVAANGVVFAMDSNAVISAFTLNSGKKLWRTATVNEDTESSNVGGGLCLDNGTLYAVNGMSEILSLDPGNGGVRWRTNLGRNARSAPTVADGRIYLSTIDSKLLALSVEDGHQLWSYQATQAPTTYLGDPAPAYAQGIVIAGFGSGEVAALRAESGAVVWTDTLGIPRGKSSLVDFLAIRGDPVVINGQVFVTGMGGLTVAADLLTGRRVWERRVASANTQYAAGGWLFVVSTDQEAGAINVDDARIAWVTTLQRWENEEKKKDLITWYGPVLAGDRLILLGSNKDMLFLNPFGGETLGKQLLSDAPSPFSPVVVDGTLLVVTEDGKLTAWR
jgi:outer membrane protein assembly factor BamB